MNNVRLFESTVFFAVLCVMVSLFYILVQSSSDTSNRIVSEFEQQANGRIAYSYIQTRLRQVDSNMNVDVVANPIDSRYNALFIRGVMRYTDYLDSDVINVSVIDMPPDILLDNDNKYSYYLWILSHDDVLWEYFSVSNNFPELGFKIASGVTFDIDEVGSAYHWFIDYGSTTRMNGLFCPRILGRDYFVQ
jgi:hypothetical protein